MSPNKRIFISAAEPSADAHCSGLIKALKEADGSLEIFGIGGDKMQAAGCRLIEKTTSYAAMGYNAITRIVYFKKLLHRIKGFISKENIGLVIVCDSPAFNFHVAKAAKGCGKKVMFYVAPQLWAWGPWRIKKLKKYCDKLCAILPFEKEWFSNRGMSAEFVGHPLLDALGDDLSCFRKSYENFDLSKVKIALMPGSRAAEIETLWVPMQQIVVKLKKKWSGIQITTVAVDDEKKQILRSMQIIGFSCHYAVDAVAKTARESDFAIASSGSATLEVAAAGCPMIIMYQCNKLAWHLIGRHLITTKYLSLVNILAQKELVPEFMPYFSSIEPIVQRCEKLLSDKNQLAELSDSLIMIASAAKGGSASQNTAKIVFEQLHLIK